MAVHRSARGGGVGVLLLAEVERFASSSGCARLALCATPFLKAAIRLDRREGFHFTGESIAPNGTLLLRVEKTIPTPHTVRR
jgi:GNAT superfamily N-acetyltransferase